MVKEIDTQSLEQLARIIERYPWYAAARLELCRRMWELGADVWTPREYAAEALYFPERRRIFSDTPVPEVADVAPRRARVPGGDYFSQEQYEGARQSSDNVFSRFAAKIREEKGSGEAPAAASVEDFATETLARIFAEQDLPQEAKRIYSRLILDFPEKSAYFASLIEKLDKEIKK